MVHCLTLQLLTRLGGYDVQTLTVRKFFEGSGDGNTVLVMEGSLPLTVNSSILGVFEVEGVPSGYFNFSTPPKLVVYIPTGTVWPLLCVSVISVHCTIHSRMSCLTPSNIFMINSLNSCLCEYLYVCSDCMCVCVCVCLRM